MAKILDTARGIVIKEGMILLMERWNDGQHYFSIPGGKIEPGEVTAQTVEREILEETGVKVRPRRLVTELRVEGSLHSIFICDYLSGEPSLQTESEEAIYGGANNKFKPGWQPIKELGNLYLRYWEPLKPTLLNGLRNGFSEEPTVVEV